MCCRSLWGVLGVCARLTPPPGGGVGRLAQSANGERGQPEPTLSTEASAEAGMADMSKRFHEEGGELYLPTE